MNPLEVGALIAAKRQEKSLTQKQLADLIHVTDKAVSKWEQGKNFPELTTLQSISAVLDIPPAQLLGFDEDKADAALLVGMKRHEEERANWLKDLRKRAWISLVCNLAILVGLSCLVRFTGGWALYNYPMSLAGAMNAMLGFLIGYSIWTIRTSSDQLKRISERQFSASDLS